MVQPSAKLFRSTAPQYRGLRRPEYIQYVSYKMSFVLPAFYESGVAGGGYDVL